MMRGFLSAVVLVVGGIAAALDAQAVVGWSADGRAFPLADGCVGHEQALADCARSLGPEDVMLRMARGHAIAGDGRQETSSGDELVVSPKLLILVVQSAPIDFKSTERALKIASQKLGLEPAWMRTDFDAEAGIESQHASLIEQLQGVAGRVHRCGVKTLEAALVEIELAADRVRDANLPELLVLKLEHAQEMYAPRDEHTGKNVFESVSDAAFRLAQVAEGRAVLFWTATVPQVQKSSLLQRQDDIDGGEGFAPDVEPEPFVDEDANVEEAVEAGSKNGTQFAFKQTGDLPPPPITPAGFMGLLVMFLLVLIFYFGFSCLFAIQTPYAFPSPEGDSAAKKNQ